MSYQHMQWAIAQDVPPTQAHVLLVLAMHVGRNDAAFPFIATLCNETKLSRTAVKDALRGLASAELIKIEQTENGANRYFLQMPAPVAEAAPKVVPFQAPIHELEPPAAELEGGRQTTGGGRQTTGGGRQTTAIKNNESTKKINTQGADLFTDESQPPAKASDPYSMPLPECLPLPLWREWIAYRRERRLTCIPTTLSRQIKLIKELNAEGISPQAVIEQSIQNGWQGLFRPKATTPAPAPEPFRQSSRRVYS
jgi:hypothetical protein